MPAVLNTNMASLYAQKNLSTAQADLATSVQRLSSGKRINSAKDDAAGFAVAEAVAATKNITDQSIRNTQDAISLVQTAEGALDVVGKILQRVLTLTTQKENDTLTSAQTTSINTEISSLLNEVSSIKTRSKFQGGELSIFGKFGANSLAFTTGEGSTTTLEIADLTVTTLGKTSTGVAAADGDGTADTALELSSLSTAVTAGQKIYINGIDSGRTVTTGHAASGTAFSLTVSGGNILQSAGDIITFHTDITSSSASSDVMGAIQNNLDERAKLGTWQTRLNYIVDNMQTLSNNLADAKSRIVDADYAAETAALTRGQILQQAATSMLAQANQMPNVILTLLK